MQNGLGKEGRAREDWDTAMLKWWVVKGQLLNMAAVPVLISETAKGQQSKARHPVPLPPLPPQPPQPLLPSEVLGRSFPCLYQEQSFLPSKLFPGESYLKSWEERTEKVGWGGVGVG